MRSRTGCLTCRQRKLKCDEQKPCCGQCRKASRECQPSSGIVFRHQQNASMNGEEDAASEDGSLKGFYSYKNTFDEGSVWLDIPKQVTFVDNSDPYAEPLSPDLDGTATTPSQKDVSPQYHSQSNEWDLGDNFHAPVEEAQASGLHALSVAASSDQHPFPPSLPSDPSSSTHPMDFTAPEGTQKMHPHGRIAQPPMSTDASPPGSLSSPNINFMLNPSNHISPPVDQDLQSAAGPTSHSFSSGSRTSRAVLADLRPDANVETDHEIAFLLRHYSEQPGQWMDLFDDGCYFAHFVPVKALTSPFLKYAAIAYAAKQLGRVRGNKAIMGGVCSKQATLENYPHADKVDWFYMAAKYYDKAISLLMDALQAEHSPPDYSTTVSQWQNPTGTEWYGAERRKKRRVLATGGQSPTASSDELLAGTVILSVSEFLDASGFAWSRHLNGTKSLLDIAEVGMMPFQSPSATPQHIANQRSMPSKARKATFWNFARQDFLAAFINECPTRMDTDDLALWKAAGLLLDENGLVRASNRTDSGYPEGAGVMKEDQISNALIWLMSKLVNHLATGDGLYVTPPGPGAPKGPSQGDETQSGVNQKALLEKWVRIEKEVDFWHDGLPETFRPFARVEAPRQFSDLDKNPEALFPEIWYSIPMCASTMQSYHMTRILLLINKPHEPTTGRSSVVNRLSSYRAIEAEIRYHSYEIVGIALSRPEGSVRIHALQPLFVSGQCLTEPRERRVILNLLRGIEGDLGWATNYRIIRLLREWGWDEGSSASVGSSAAEQR